MSADIKVCESTGQENAVAGEDQAVGDVCAGCVELVTRVDRLEHAIEELLSVRSDPSIGIEETGSYVAFGTTACYWLCVGIHALLVFLCSSSEITFTALYGLLIGCWEL